MTRRPKPLPRVVLLGAAGWVHAHGALLARQATVAITALAAEVTCVGWKSACAAGTLAAHEATRAGRVAGKCAAGSWRWLATRETRVPGGRRIPPPIVGEGHLFPRPGSGHRGTGAGPLGLTLFQRLRLRRRNSLALRKHEQRVPGPTVATVKRAKLHLGGIRCAAGLPLASWRIAAPRNHVYHSPRSVQGAEPALLAFKAEHRSLLAAHVLASLINHIYHTLALVIRAKTALFSLVSIKRAPAAVRLFAASANDVNHAVIFMRGAEPRFLVLKTEAGLSRARGFLAASAPHVHHSFILVLGTVLGLLSLKGIQGPLGTPCKLASPVTVVHRYGSNRSPSQPKHRLL